MDKQHNYDYYFDKNDYYSDKKKYMLKKIANKKFKVIKSLNSFWNTDKDLKDFYPNSKEIPLKSILIEIIFELKTPYTSKDESELRIIQKELHNPIVRDKLTGFPIVRPSTWKGALRFAAQNMTNYKNKEMIIKRLFGSETDNNTDQLKGSLYFYTTFFNKQEPKKKEIITPIDRSTKISKGPIFIEVIKPGHSARFYLLYFPLPNQNNIQDEKMRIKEDLEFLADALSVMFYIFGFSAKRTAGFGVIKDLKENSINIYSRDKINYKKYFAKLWDKKEIENVFDLISQNN